MEKDCVLYLYVTQTEINPKKQGSTEYNKGKVLQSNTLPFGIVYDNVVVVYLHLFFYLYKGQIF